MAGARNGRQGPKRVPEFVRHPKIRERLIEALSAGNYQRTSAIYAGVAPATLDSWLNRARHERDEDLDTEYTKLLQDVESAEAEAEVYAVAIIRRSMTDNWTAAMTFLERKKPHEWGRKTIVEGGDKPIGIQAQLVALTDVDLDALEAKLESRRNGVIEAG